MCPYESMWSTKIKPHRHIENIEKDKNHETGNKRIN